MMHRLGVFFILFMGALLTLEGQDSLSERDFESFVTVYMTQKQFTPPASIDIEQLLAKHDVSADRYGKIFQGHLHQQRVSLSEHEMALVQDIEKENKRLEKQKEVSLKKACGEYAITHDVYQSILHKYKTSIAFQRSLKPYFDQYINQRK